MISTIPIPPQVTLRGDKVDFLPRESGCKWWIGCVKSRMEFRFASELRARQVSYCLPRERYESTDAGRRVFRYRVLFPGYIFILANSDDFYRMGETKRMWRRFRPDRGGQAFLREDLQRVLCFGDLVSYKMTVEDFQVGDRVKIVEPHPLAGQTAYSVQGIKSGRILIPVRVLMTAAEFSIDPQFLQPV